MGNFMKNLIQKLSFLAVSTLVLGGCGKNGRYNPYGYGYGGGGACRGPAGGGGPVMYSETGTGTAFRNGVPAHLELTLYVDNMGRVGASGSLDIPDAGMFFNDGFGGNPYTQAPIGGALRTCVDTRGPSGSWDDFSNQTASPLFLDSGIVQIQMGPGAYVSSNGLFVPNAQMGIRGYMSPGDVTFSPGGF
jgi:hypothetical protein